MFYSELINAPKATEIRSAGDYYAVFELQNLSHDYSS